METNYEIDIIDENEVEVLDRGYDEVYEEDSSSNGFVKGAAVGGAIALGLVGGFALVRKLTGKNREAKQIKELEAKGYTVCKIEPAETEVDGVVENEETEE